MIPVKDYMTSKLVCVKPDDPMAKARTLIRKHGFRALPVVEGDTLVGIISRSDILKVTSTRTNLKVRGLMNSNVATVSVEDDIMRVAKAIVKNRIRQVPVVDGRKIVGILSALDIVGALIKHDITPVKKKIRDVMSVDVVSCTPDDGVSAIWNKMTSTGFSGLPVLEKNRVVGIVTKMDLITHGSARPQRESGKNKHVPVKKVMESKVVAVKAGEDTRKVAELMAERRIIQFPVVDAKMKLLGFVDIEDVLRAYV